MPELTYHNNLIIGLGGTGGRVLKELRKRIYDEFDETPDGIGFMYVDSSRELMRHDDPTWLTPDVKNAQFFEREFLDISVKPLSDPLAALLKHFPNLKGIIENCERLKNYRPEAAAMQDRRLGRVLLGFHATEFDCLLRDRVLHLQNQTRSSDLNITVVTGLSGGTGSGCVISVIAHILQLYPDAIISVMATLPTIPPPPMHDTGRYLANAYAALRELNALNIGKLKLTDLVTGEKFQPELPYNRSLDFCHRLQENKLFRLFLFDSFRSEYDMIANILYHNIWLGTGNSAVETYRRNLEMYATIPAPEFNAAIEEGEYIEARTRAVGALGLYRIIYPRKQILRHIAYHTAIQIYNQLLFNHFVEDIGYVETPVTPAPVDMKMLIWWKMDKRHLMLDPPYDITQSKFMSFCDEWEKASHLILTDIVKNDVAEPLREMQYRFNDYYENLFRHEGVRNYFISAENSIYIHVEDCIETYKNYIVPSILSGKKGVCDVINQTNQLVDYIRERREENGRQRIECENEIRRWQDIINETVRDYECSNILIRIIKKSEYIQRLNADINRLYKLKTEYHALEYENCLLMRLEPRVHEIVSEFDKIKLVLTRECEQANKLANDERQSPTNTLFVVDWNKVKEYEHKLFNNRHEMESISLLVREVILKGWQQSFDKFASIMEEGIKVKNIKPIFYNFINKYDYSLFLGIGKLLHGKNVFFELGLLIPKNLPIMPQVIEQALEKAIPEVQLKKVLQSSSLKRHGLRHDPHTVFLISVPHTTLLLSSIFTKSFVDCLNKIIYSLPKGVEVVIDSNAENEHEISFASVQTNLTIQNLEILSKLKEQYNSLMSNKGTQAANMLHTEDAFENLPSLEI